MKVTPKEGKEFIRQHWAKIDPSATLRVNTACTELGRCERLASSGVETSRGVDEIERVRKGPGITKRELNALIRQRFDGKSMSFLSLDELEALIDCLKSKTA